MPSLYPYCPGLARTLSLWAAALALVCAQFLLAAHAHGDEHGHEGDEAEPTCSLCLHKAAGHELLAPLGAGATMPPLPWPGAAAPVLRAEPAFAPGWWLCHPARGPPAPQPMV